jgi:predicted TIM-barrel fold metal-dependent hydrolase
MSTQRWYRARRMNRRHLLAIAATAGASLVGARHGFLRAARPASPQGALSAPAQALFDRAWEGLDPSRVLDMHAHVVGLGTGGTGCWVNPRMHRYLRHPLHYARFSIYKRAAGVTDMDDADQQYVAMLVARIRAQRPHGRMLILGFDYVYGQDGERRSADSEFYTPNDYVLRLSREHPDCFVPAASIHPYRKDAVDTLHQVVEAGAVAVKWLPNAHVIDPASPRCDDFYRALVELDVPLITHAGEERAVHAEEAQKLGNPLRLRRPLELGVKVVVAHCASLGQGEDLDAGAGAPMVDNFELFLRLLAEPAWEDRLYGDISALPQFNRAGRPLAQMLARGDLHHRLVNGSDYPLPAINALTRTGVLVGLGYLSDADRELLNELDRHNPLAFDFTLKRTLRVRADGSEQRFARDVFHAPPALFSRLPPAPQDAARG